MAETNQPQSEEISNSIEKSETEIKNSTVASTSNNSLAIDDIKIVTDDYLEALVSYVSTVEIFVPTKSFILYSCRWIILKRTKNCTKVRHQAIQFFNF